MTRRIKDNFNACAGSVKDTITTTTKNHDHETLPRNYTLSQQKHLNTTRPELHKLKETNDEMKRQLNLLPDSVDKRLISEEVNSFGEHIDRQLKDFEDKEPHQGFHSLIEQCYGPRVAALMFLCLVFVVVLTDRLCLVFVVVSTDRYGLADSWMLRLLWLCVLCGGFFVAGMLGRRMRQ